MYNTKEDEDLWVNVSMYVLLLEKFKNSTVTVSYVVNSSSSFTNEPYFNLKNNLNSVRGSISGALNAWIATER